MSDPLPVSPAELGYASGRYESEVKFHPIENGVAICLPGPRNRAILWFAISALAILLFVTVAGVWPAGRSWRGLAPLFYSCCLAVVVFLGIAYQDLKRADRLDVVLATTQGVRVQSWAPELARDLVILWPEVLECRLAHEGRKRFLLIVGRLFTIPVRLHRHSVNEADLLDCLERYRQVRMESAAAKSEPAAGNRLSD